MKQLTTRQYHCIWISWLIIICKQSFDMTNSCLFSKNWYICLTVVMWQLHFCLVPGDGVRHLHSDEPNHQQSHRRRDERSKAASRLEAQETLSGRRGAVKVSCLCHTPRPLAQMYLILSHITVHEIISILMIVLAFQFFCCCCCLGF